PADIEVLRARVEGARFKIERGKQALEGLEKLLDMILTHMSGEGPTAKSPAAIPGTSAIPPAPKKAPLKQQLAQPAPARKPIMIRRYKAQQRPVTPGAN